MPTQEELEWLQQQAAPPTSPSHMADLYHDGQIGYKTAFESIMSLLRQPGSGVDPGDQVAHALALLSRSATPIPDPPITLPDPTVTLPDPEVPIDDSTDPYPLAKGGINDPVPRSPLQYARELTTPEDTTEDTLGSLVWMQNPQEEWAVQLGGKPENLYRIQVREEQVAGLVDAGWSTEDEDMTASEWARLTQQPVGSAEYIKIWGDDAEEDDTISSGGEDPIGAFSRRTRFLSSIGQGGRGPKDPYEMYQAGLFNPLNRLFELKDLFGIALGDTAPEQETFFGRGAEFAKDPKSIYGQSRDILARLLNLGKEGRRTSGVSFTPEWEGDFGQTSADISNEDMADLFHMALRSKTSRGTARRFASRLKPGSSGGELGIEQSLHEEAVAAGLTEQPFLEWIRDKYNLGSLLGV